MLKTHLEVVLQEKHLENSRTKHIVFGEVVGRPDVLAICSYEGTDGYYLFHLSKDREEMSDSFHDSIGDAKEQAKWEYDVQFDDWSEP